MANEEHLAIIKEGPKAWNAWREGCPDVRPELNGANLRGTDLEGADLSGAEIREANLTGANLTGANLTGANLEGADLSGAELFAADLSRTNLIRTRLHRVSLNGGFADEGCMRADLSGANLTGADLFEANLSEANLTGANLTGAYLWGAILRSIVLIDANLIGAELREANLNGANLSGADLSGAYLGGATLINTNLTNANLNGANIYGISAWNVNLDEAVQKDLVITPSDEPQVTVDNLEVAQFIYLLLNNKKLTNVINTIGEKGVLILGRFAPERKVVLDAIRDKLREGGFLPMIFDFDKPTRNDFTGTIKVLAGMSRFIIADITNPKSSPLELQATVPDYMTPLVPIIHAEEEPFSMFLDLQQKYDWVFDVLKYDSVENLMHYFEEEILKPALEMSDKLLARKTQAIRARHLGEST